MSDICLRRLNPTLADHLGVLGMWRTAEQLQAGHMLTWIDGGTLRTPVELQILLDYWLHQYKPTPVLNPWNGSTGFDGKPFGPLEAIESGCCERLGVYRRCIETARQLKDRAGIEGKPSTKPPKGGGLSDKDKLIELLRARMPNGYLSWVDVVGCMGEEGMRYNPLAGTGGNVGRMDIQRRYMESLELVMDLDTGEPTPQAEMWLRSYVTGEMCWDLPQGTMGMYRPLADPRSEVQGSKMPHNPWDWIFLVEGLCMLGGSASYRYEGNVRRLPYPWVVSYNGIDSGNTIHAHTDGEAEIWLPMWTSLLSYAEGLELLAQGPQGLTPGGARPVDGMGMALATASAPAQIRVECARYGIVPEGQSLISVRLGEPRVTMSPAL